MAGRQGQTSVEIKKTPMQSEKGYSLGNVLCSIPLVMYVCDVFFSKNAWPESLSTQPEASLWQPSHYCFEKRLLKAFNRFISPDFGVERNSPVWQKHGQRNEQGRGWLLHRPPRQPLIARLVVFIHLSMLPHSDLAPYHCRFAVPWLLAASLSSAASASFLLSASPAPRPAMSSTVQLWLRPLGLSPLTPLWC